VTDHPHLEPLLSKLVAVCETFTQRMKDMGGTKPVFEEPYAPHLPSISPRVLVLAESQNLTDAAYVSRLSGDDPAASRRRILRLLDGTGSGKIGVEPWDNGILKIAVQGALDEIDPSEVAVSNAIPWSWTAGAANTRPFNSKVIALAADFWREIFREWMPEKIITAGAVARSVIKIAKPSAKVMNWALPSPRLDPAAGMFDPQELMRRFEIPEEIRTLVPDGARPQIAFYLCHAVSQARRVGGQ
jgi:hypothetical protein